MYHLSVVNLTSLLIFICNLINKDWIDRWLTRNGNQTNLIIERQLVQSCINRRNIRKTTQCTASKGFIFFWIELPLIIYVWQSQVFFLLFFYLFGFGESNKKKIIAYLCIHTLRSQIWGWVINSLPWLKPGIT